MAILEAEGGLACGLRVGVTCRRGCGTVVTVGRQGRRLGIILLHLALLEQSVLMMSSTYRLTPFGEQAPKINVG